MVVPGAIKTACDWKSPLAMLNSLAIFFFSSMSRLATYNSHTRLYDDWILKAFFGLSHLTPKHGVFFKTLRVFQIPEFFPCVFSFRYWLPNFSLLLKLKPQYDNKEVLKNNINKDRSYSNFSTWYEPASWR